MYACKIWWSALGLTTYNGQSVFTCVVTHFICRFSNHTRDLCCESHLLTNKWSFTTWYPKLITNNAVCDIRMFYIGISKRWQRSREVSILKVFVLNTNQIWLVTVFTHGDFIVLPHCKTGPLALWSSIFHSVTLPLYKTNQSLTSNLGKHLFWKSLLWFKAGFWTIDLPHGKPDRALTDSAVLHGPHPQDWLLVGGWRFIGHIRTGTELWQCTLMATS